MSFRRNLYKACLDSYGMTNVLVIIFSYLTLNLQPGLSGNPFLHWKSPGKKDWERKTDKAAIIILVIG
ncbi:hypothetical protein ACFP3I_05030 [Chryseobacterium arachidis]|uniref:hypothetical protein n=1 Tax=Chryseobacterium arachidis TaxID=1416778 RepID=UPI0036064872